MPSRFSVGEVFNQTFRLFFRNIGPLMVIGLLAYLPMYLFGLFSPNSYNGELPNPYLAMAVFPITFILVYLMQGAVVHGVYEGLNGRPFRLGSSVGVALRRLLVLLGVSIVVGVLQSLASMLLIIPGIMVACMWWVVVPAVVVEKMGVGKALSRSAELTQGYRMRIFGIWVIVMAISFMVAMVMGFLVMFLGSSFMPYWLIQLLNTAAQVVPAMLTAVATTVGYYYLRMDVEGVDLSELASVFE